MEIFILIKRTLRYFFGCALLLFSFLALAFESSFAIFIFMLIGGLVCLPPTCSWIEDKLKLRLPTAVKYIIVIFAWLSIGIYGKPVEETKSVVQPVQSLYEPAKDNTPGKVPNTGTAITTTAPVKDNIQEAAEQPIVEDKQPELRVREEPAPPAPVRSHRSRHRASNREYIRGPRGGCYYINSNGNKTYVDRSLCD